MKHLLILLLLAGCVPTEYPINHAGVIVIGDSLCQSAHDSFGNPYPIIAGVKMDCVSARRSIDYPDALPNYETIIYALGSNDAGFKVPIQDYRDDLTAKFLGTDATVYCVLPDNNLELYTDVRQAMFELCANTIEPRDHGYNFSANDGIHGTANDHLQFGLWLNKFLSAL